MAKSAKAKNDEKKKERLVPITVRFTPGAMEAIGDVARRHNMTKAEIVRIAVDGKLSSYLGNLVYVDDRKAQKIYKEVSELGTELEKIRYELNRIGVNYNQEIRLKNIERKYAKKSDYESIKRKEKEMDAVRSESLNITPRDLNAIIRRYESALAKASEQLAKLVK